MRSLNRPSRSSCEADQSAPSKPSRPSEGNTTVKSWRRILFTLARLGVGVGLIVYLAKSGFINFLTLGRIFTLWPLTLAALALILIHITLISARLSLLFRPQSLTLPLKTSIRLTLVGLFFDTFMPGASGGTVAKLYYATRETGGRRAEVATVVVFDRVIGLFSLLVLPLIVAPMFHHLIASVHILRVILMTYAAICGFLFAVFMFCLLRQQLMSRFAGILPYEAVRKFVSRALETIGTYRHKPRTLLSAFGLSLLANLAIVGVIGVGLLVVSPGNLAWRICQIVPIGQIVNSLPITPGGLGVGEVAFNSLFSLAGLSGGAEALLCWRIWAVMMSGLGLYFYVRGMGRRIVEVEDSGESAQASKAGEPEATRGLQPRRSSTSMSWGANERLNY